MVICHDGEGTVVKILRNSFQSPYDSEGLKLGGLVVPFGSGQCVGKV